MKISRPFRCFVLILSIVLLSGGFILLNSAAGGPPTRWKVQFLNTSQNLIGYPLSDQTYLGGADGVNIVASTGSCGSGSDKTFYSRVRLEVALPSQIRFLLDPIFYDIGFDPALVQCGFPNTSSVWPLCLSEFLSQPQPFAGDASNIPYDIVSLIFTTGLCSDRISTNFLEMPVGGVLIGGITINAVGQSAECPGGANPSANHNLRFNAQGYYRSPGDTTPDIFMTRTSPTEWILSIDTDFNNPANQHGDSYVAANDHIFEWYYECVTSTGKGGKTTVSPQIRYSAWTKTPFRFQMKLTKY